MTVEVLAVVQARVSSSRLPGKVLAPVIGKPMVIRQLERIARSQRIDKTVLATSNHPTDDGLVEQLAEYGTPVRRGDLNDVYSRFAKVVSEFQPQHIVRLTADCPLTDPQVIDQVVEAHLSSGADYTSNVLHRTFPHGLDVECMTTSAFRRVGELNLSAQEREHVTSGIYSRPEIFSLHSVTQPIDKSTLRWTVDYPEDLEFVRAVYGALHTSTPAFSTQDIYDYLTQHPELSRTASDV